MILQNQAPWVIQLMMVLLVGVVGISVTAFTPSPANSVNGTSAFRNAGSKASSNLANIYGGFNVLQGQFPFMAGIYANNNFSCGASIIAPSWVVTAAHCLVIPDDTVGSTKAFFRTPTAQLSVGVGSIFNTTTKMTGVKQIVVAPSYNAINNTHDIALVELVTPLTYGSDINPIRISTAPVKLHQTLMALGWGYTQNKSISTTLQGVNLTTTTDENCRRGFPSWDGQGGDLICTGETPGRDTCYGDSGGPLIKENTPGSGVYLLVGLTSFGIDLNNALSTQCGQSGGVGYYTKLARHIAWISSTTKVGVSDLTSSAIPTIMLTNFEMAWTVIIGMLAVKLSDIV